MKRTLPCLLLIALLLCACSSGSLPFPTQNSAGEVPAVTAAPAETTPPTPDQVVIYDAFYEAGYYSDDLNNSWQYTLRIPAIQAPGEDATRLNQQLYSKLYPAVKDVQDAMAGKYSLSVWKVDYAVHVNGQLISIVAEIDTDWNFDEYYTVNFDASVKKEVSRAELLSRFDLTEEQFIALASEKVAESFNQNAGSLTGDEFWRDRYEKSVARENFTDDCQLFVNDRGQLSMIVRVYSMAGADYYYHIFEITG